MVANFPQVEMADFHEHRATALFYVIYVGIGMYFMLNLFLALVYRSFADLEKVFFSLYHSALPYSFAIRKSSRPCFCTSGLRCAGHSRS